MTPQPDGRCSSARPEDVDTGFWLWVAALPLLSICYLTDVATSPAAGPILIGFAVLFVVVLATVVGTFLPLMRAGYRWARTVLTAGGLSSIIFVGMNVFGTERPPVAAVLCAVTGIVGAVLVGGGIYLLHRSDAHAYFTR